MKDILLKAMRAGVKLIPDGDNLRVAAGPGGVDAELIENIRLHKSELIELLRMRQVQAEVEHLRVTADPERRHDPFPLTDVQHAYWLGRQGVAESGQVSTHLYHELDCPALDIARFEAALRRVIERHDMLRAVISDDGTQRVLPAVPPFEVRVHHAADEAEGERIVLALRAALASEVRPAGRWPLFDMQAVRMPNGGTRLHVSLDMLILDGWSMSLMFEEALKLYRAPEMALPPLSLTFRDFVLAERKLRDGPAYRRAREYWLERVETLPAAPELPKAAKAPSGQPRFVRREARLERATWTALKNRARTHGLTGSSLLLAVYAEVLARWSGGSRFTLNLTLFNRPAVHPEIMHVLGDFTSLVMLEVDQRERGTDFAERARRLQKRLMTDLDHREFGGVEVLREWRARKREGASASMPVVFTSALVLSEDGEDFEYGAAEEEFGALRYAVSQTPQVWLDNQVMESRGGLLIMWDTVDANFAPGVLNEMFDAQVRLLHDLAGDEACWSRAVAVELPPAMQRRRLEANATEAPRLARLLQHGFLEWARRTPQAAAVISASRTLSYRQLLAESATLARALLRQGMAAGEPVAVMMHKGWEQVVGVLAVLLAGGAYLPVDAGLPLARRRSLLEIGGVRHILTQGPAAADEAALHGYRVHPVLPLAPAEGAIDVPQPGAKPSDLAYVIFTSGTTGVPKGVMIEHAAAWNTIEHINRMLRVAPNDRILAVSALGFDLSVYDIFGMLGAGAALVLPERTAALDPTAWKRQIAAHGVSLWNSAPQLMRMLVDTFGPDEIGQAPVRAVLLSGDWIGLELPDAVRRHFPAAQVTSLGGATEASIWSNYFPVGAIDPQWSSIPYGKPLPNQTMRVLDAQFRPCPDHTIGRIYIGGLGLARGYWGDPDRTAERFVTDPHTGERLYDTGDLGRYAPDGNIIFLGRADTQAKIRGNRVEPGEIAAVLRRHPAVEEAAVLVLDRAGGRKELVAYVQIDPASRDFALPLEPASNRHALAGVPLARALDACGRDGQARRLDDSLRATWEALDQLYASAMPDALRRFGVQGEPGERIDIDALLAKGIAARYHRWLQRALDALVADGFARADGYRCVELVKPLPRSRTAELLAQAKRGLQADLGFSDEECGWYGDSVARLADILSEKLHLAELYASDHMAGLYQKLFPDSHAELARVVSRLAAGHDGPLNVLEVGGGLGTATLHLLPILERHGCRYTFTDVSEFFLMRARRLFGAARPPLEFGLLDLETRPDFQGYPRHGYDLVIASCMLHEVRDVRVALGHIRAALKPGGHLVLLEATRLFLSFDLSIGLLQGFDAYTDEALRGSSPLLSCEQWLAALGEAGFADAVALRQPGSVTDALGFHVMVARVPLNQCALDTRAVTGYLAGQLPDYMVPPHVVQMDRIPTTVNGKIDYRALPAIPDHAVLPSCMKVAPRTPTEQALLDIWLRLLPGHEIGVTDNFFDIGGDSMVAIQVIRDINDGLARNLEVNDFFENMSIEALAKLVDSREIVVDLL